MRAGNRPGFSLGRTALTGWALTAVLGLAGFGTAVGATPVPVAETTPLGGFGTVFRGSAPAVDPRTALTVGQVVNPVALAGDVVPVLPMGTVTAVSVPTPVAAPTGTVAAPGAGSPDLAVGGTTPGATPGATVPAGPAAQLRQAAFTAAAPDQRASLAIRTALAQLGLPYVWGGDGPTNGDAGFDCSGLTTFSYGTAGVLLPRTAHTQYNAGPHVPADAALQPGDLVFYGTSARVHHVGMYLGAGRMVNAPTFGKPVQVAFYRYRGDDYLGATRPAAAGGSLTTGVLPYVDPVPAVPDVALAPAQRQQQAQERVFQAPAASLPAVLPQPGDATLPSEQQSAAQSIAESDAVARATPQAVAPRPVVGPVAVDPATVDPPAQSGGGSAPVAGTTTASSAPITTSPTAPPADVTTPAATSTPGTATAGTSTAAPESPAGSATSATSTTAAPAAPPAESSVAPATATQAPTTGSPAASSSTPVVVEKAQGSTTATTTLAPTSTVRTTTPKATTSKVAKPVAPKTTTATSTVKTVTTPTPTAKAVTTTSKPAAKTEDDDPTTTKTKASKTKTSKTKTAEDKATEEKSSDEKTSDEKTSSEKSSSEKSSSSDEGDD